MIPEIVEGDDAEMTGSPGDEFIPEEYEPPIYEAPGGDPENLSDDTGLIDESVEFINRTVAEMVVNAALKIGDYVLVRFFNNDIFLASSMNGHKSVSYSRLCRRPDLSLTRQQLSTMVRIAAQEKYFLIMNMDTARLQYIHRLRLIELPNDHIKCDLASECMNQNLTGGQLRARIRQIKLSALLYENPAYVNQKIVTDYKKTVERGIKGMVLPELLSTQDGLYRLDREILLQLKADAAGWVSALEARWKHAWP